MKPANASNVALALAVVAWPLAYYGVLSQMGDYGPYVPRAEIVANSHRSIVVLVAGVLCFCSALWLSGFAHFGAPRRAILAIFICTAPMTVLFLSLWQ